jgi:hypothetical protein
VSAKKTYRTVKVGDIEHTGGWTWVVVEVSKSGKTYVREITGDPNGYTRRERLSTVVPEVYYGEPDEEEDEV